MLFTSAALQDVERKQFDQLGELLGTTWTRERVQALMSKEPPARDQQGKTKPRERLVIPMLMGINAKILDFVTKSFGGEHGIDAPGWYKKDHGEIVEGYDMPRDEFIRLASMFTPLTAAPKPLA
ncbi:hypothetical protein LCGC14_0938600 [marine sediment metagenome]|uniref:Uncharacterized protein n=1 Tax=marine sediment metagenome TaxID=412755 RepID=A0A0F9NQF5_9ZZZZ